MVRSELYQYAKDTWGRDAQLVVAMEELAELIQELSKWIRGKPDYTNLVEETADVQIMLSQIEFLASSEYPQFVDEVNKVVEYKLARLKQRLEEEQK